MQRLPVKAAGLALVLLASLLLITPLRAQDASVAAEGVAWKPFEKAVQLAAKEKKPLVVDIYAPWCTWCRRLQREVYVDPAVQAYLAKHFVVTRLNGDDTASKLTFKEYDLTSAELAQGLGAEGYPTTVFLSATSDYITRLPGFVDAGEFVQILRFIGSGAYQKLTYPEYVAQQQAKK